MFWILLGGLVLVLLLLSANRVSAMDPRVLAQGVRFAAIAAASMALLRSGRWSFFLLPALQRWMREAMATPWSGPKAAPQGRSQATSVETQTMRMHLDHASGTVDGEVLAGAFRGRRLADLSVAELAQLLDHCRAGDADSVPLLEAYLDRRDPDWRETADQRRQETQDPRRPSTGLTREEAWRILDLEPGAPPEEIRAAHHRLMKKLHPDQGGSNYLATQVNQAKDLLLRG